MKQLAILTTLFCMAAPAAAQNQPEAQFVAVKGWTINADLTERTKTKTVGECAAKCLSKGAACIGFDYRTSGHWKDTCFFKKSTRGITAKDDSYVLHMRNAEAHRMFKKFTGKTINADLTERTKTKTSAECARQCLKRSGCMAFDYRTSGQWKDTCFFKKSTRGLTSKDDSYVLYVHRSHASKIK